jgi:hypothetical protein
MAKKKDEEKLERAQERTLDRAVTRGLPNSQLAFPTEFGKEVYAISPQTIPNVVDRISSGNRESIFNATAARYAAQMQSPVETNFQTSRNIQSPNFPEQSRLASSFATPFDSRMYRENVMNERRYSPSPFGDLSVAQNQAIAGSAESRQYTSGLEDIQQNRVLPEFARREAMTATPFSQNEFGGRERTIPLPSGGQVYQSILPEGRGFGSITRTPEAVAQQQAQIAGREERAQKYGAALARAKEIGAQNTKTAQEDSLRRSANFFASINAERAAREEAKAKAEQARGGSGRGATARATQFSVQSELYSQRAANVGKTVKNPVTGKMEPAKTPFFSWEPITMKSGEQYLPSGMGQYTKITGSGFGSGVSGGPQPSSRPTNTTPPLATSTLGGNLALGGFQNPALFNPTQSTGSSIAGILGRTTRRRRRPRPMVAGY